MKQYYINAIRLDKENKHIEWVRIRKNGHKEYYVIRRQLAAHLIESGISFKTRYLEDKKWKTGAEVEVFEGDFLKANPNSTAKDNLRNLEVF
ncbi:DUF3892 domain-containing protein [Pseudomonas sp. WS 5096]|uniref:DUF3892 domain-containing protein n=1 Tax=Pseudomonas cremoris TaxID=2724178 RepID=A0ABR6TCQ9_9PSED|nr:DUF3892 domain-containing protein [Pseudomonas cremoris]MBC2383575.1 DUF3892 domain-containing protein [Pseudomonas cremoris]